MQQVVTSVKLQCSITMDSAVAPSPERISLMFLTKLLGPQIVLIEVLHQRNDRVTVDVVPEIR